MSPDPMGIASGSLTNPQSLNLYAYVLNNPLINIDPTGYECVWDDGSFDAESDPDSGTPGQCQGQGGTWIELGYNGAWSDSQNQQFAEWVQAIADNANNGLPTIIGTYNQSTGITSFTSYNSSGLVDQTGTSGINTQYGYDPGSVSAFAVSSYYDPGRINQIYSSIQEVQFAQQDPDAARINAPNNGTKNQGCSVLDPNCKQPSKILQYVTFLGCEFNSDIEQLTDEEDAQHPTSSYVLG